MNDIQKRAYVSALYRGLGWKETVKTMPIDQVTAIFLKHQRDGTMPKQVEEKKEEDPQRLLDISTEPLPPKHGPHHNEDEFPIV